MKDFIKNREGKKISVIVYEAKNQKGLVFVMHGLGGWKEQAHVQTFAQAFKANDFTTVLFDATHTYGESEGMPEDATTTNYLEDLEDVISWAKTQAWYKQPFWLAGHSLGAFACALYAERSPRQVKGLAPISTVVSGKLSAETREKDTLEKWKRDGIKTEPSSTKPGLIKSIKWAEFEDRMKYDLLPDAQKLTMPVLLITGEQDKGTPPEHQKILYDALPGKKELHIIKNAPHTFKDPQQLEQIKNIFDFWIKDNL